MESELMSAWDDYRREERKPENKVSGKLRCVIVDVEEGTSKKGNPISEDHEWYKPVTQLARYLEGSQQQVTIFKDIRVDGVDFLLHGVLDFLRAGVIYDTKYSKTYRLNKYLNSPQHPMYLELVPEAYRFEYLICDGTWVYRETYPRDIVSPIEPTIRNFMKYLDIH